MSWLLNLLTPGKRKVEDHHEDLQPKKKSRSLKRNLFGAAIPEGDSPLEEDNLQTVETKSSKDLASILSRELTVNLVTEKIVDSVTEVAGSYKNFKPDSIADLARTGITTSESSLVAVPRIAQSAVTLECRLKKRICIEHEDGEVAFVVAIAEVVCIVAGRKLTEKTAEGQLTINPAKLQPVAVLGGAKGGRLTDFYPLPLDPTLSVKDSPAPIIPPVQPADSPLPIASNEGVPLTQETAEAVAVAVVNSIANQPSAPAVNEVEVTLKTEVSAAKSTLSKRSISRSQTREGTPMTRSKTREATPISVIVQQIR